MNDTGHTHAVRAGAVDRPLPASRRVIMAGTHPRTMGGISSVVRGYTEAGLFRRFDAVYVVTHRDGGRWTKLSAAVRGWAVMARELMRGGAPLVHVHLSSRASFWRKFVIALETRTARRPYLLHVHGSEFMRFYGSECGPITRRLVRWTFDGAAMVIALSDRWREDLRTISPRAHIVVLPNAVALPALPPRRSNGPTTVVFLGRLGERKGVFDLLHAFARIARAHPDARLVCAGDGAIDEAAVLAANLGITARCTFPGWLDGPAMCSLLADAQVFALPSSAEGLPMALLEAMSWGLAPLVTPVGGIPQVVRDGENGVLVAPRDVDGLAAALAGLLAQPLRRARLGAAARATIERSFSLEQALGELGRLYGGLGVSAHPTVSES